MSERPTLTISASCPTCGGKGTITDLVKMSTYPFVHATQEKCPDCTDGTIRQAVSCQSCSHWVYDGIGERRCINLNRNTYADWGCLSWTAKEG